MSVSGLGLGGYHDCAKAKLGPRIWSWSGRLWSIQRRVSSCHLLRADWWCWADDSGVAVVIIIIYQCCYVSAIQFKSNHSFFLFLVLAWIDRKTHLPSPLHHTPSLHHNRTNTPTPRHPTRAAKHHLNPRYVDQKPRLLPILHRSICRDCLFVRQTPPE